MLLQFIALNAVSVYESHSSRLVEIAICERQLRAAYCITIVVQ
jgi:hypothetical protein